MGRLTILLMTSLITTSYGSFCGENGVPFSLEILPNGNPVLGCAQPSCIALSEGEDDSIFEADPEGQFDGYFRDEERTSHLQANKFKANCSGKFDAVTCPKKNQWVGGIDFVNHPRQPLILQCCSFEGLRFSQDVGVTTIAAGEAVTGGEVIREGRQISFDVIANVRKILDRVDNQKVVYEVTVRRMNCLPDPSELQTPFDEDIGDEMERVLGTSSSRDPTPESEVDPQKFFQQKTNKQTNPKHVKPHKPELTFGAPTFDPSSSDRILPPRREVSEPTPAIEGPFPASNDQPSESRPSQPSEESKFFDGHPNIPPFIDERQQPYADSRRALEGRPLPSDADAAQRFIHPRYVEERPPSEYSTTVPPPTTTPTTTTPLPTTTFVPDYEFGEPVTPTIQAPKVNFSPPESPATVAPPTTTTLPNPFALPQPQPNPFFGFPPFQPFPGLGQPPQQAPAAFGAPQAFNLAPLAPPTTPKPTNPPAPNPFNPFAQPNPALFNPWLPQQNNPAFPNPALPQAPALPNPFAPPTLQPPATTFNGNFGAPPGTTTNSGSVPGLEEKPKLVTPVLRTSSIYKHGPSPPAPASTPGPPAPNPAAPFLLPPPPAFPTLFGPFQLQG